MSKTGKKYLVLPFALVCLALTGATTSVQMDNERTREESVMTEQIPATTRRYRQIDLDFSIGSWKIQNRRLKQRLKGSDSWQEFEGAVVARKIRGGAANVDEYEAESPSGRIQGMTVRLYN